MNATTNPTTVPAEVAARVRADIERLSTITTVAKNTGITVQTLRRHLMYRPDQLTVAELCTIGALLRTDPREYFGGGDEA